MPFISTRHDSRRPGAASGGRRNTTSPEGTCASAASHPRRRTYVPSIRNCGFCHDFLVLNDLVSAMSRHSARANASPGTCVSVMSSSGTASKSLCTAPLNASRGAAATDTTERESNAHAVARTVAMRAIMPRLRGALQGVWRCDDLWREVNICRVWRARSRRNLDRGFVQPPRSRGPPVAAPRHSSRAHRGIASAAR